MRQRHVATLLWLVAAFYFATMIAGYLVMDHLRPEKPKFVDPIIWREPWTDGEPQLQPDI